MYKFLDERVATAGCSDRIIRRRLDEWADVPARPPAAVTINCRYNASVAEGDVPGDPHPSGFRMSAR